MYTRFMLESIALWPNRDSQRQDEAVLRVNTLRPPNVFHPQIRASALLGKPHSASDRDCILVGLGPGLQRKGQPPVAATETKGTAIGALQVGGKLAPQSQLESVIRAHSALGDQIAVRGRPGAHNGLSGQAQLGHRLPS